MARRWRSRGHRQQGGFTLLELLVAFMVLVLAFTVLLRIFSGGLTSVGDAGAHSRAVEHARGQLALAQSETALSPGERSGETDDGYRWQLTVAPVESPGASAEAGELLRLSAQVSWGEAPTRTVSLWTLHLQDAQGPGLSRAGRRP